MPRFPNLTVLDHPLIQHKLAILRDKRTPTKEFRALVSEIAMLMTYEVTRDLPTWPVDVETPLETARCRMVAGKKLTLVPILRAGLGMVDGISQLIPSARIGHIGLYRDHDTLPVRYYFKVPREAARDWMLDRCWQRRADRPWPLSSASSRRPARRGPASDLHHPRLPRGKMR
jgi:uracil phosphoribosyltransferase